MCLTLCALQAPNLREKALLGGRNALSDAFVSVVARGLEKSAAMRFRTADALADALYSCLVAVGEGTYSTFISFNPSSERLHAKLFHEVLNNSVTPAGHRVINYLDTKRLSSTDNWEESLSQGLLNSLVALPLVCTQNLSPRVCLPALHPVIALLKSTPGGNCRFQQACLGQSHRFRALITIHRVMCSKSLSSCRSVGSLSPPKSRFWHLEPF